jgi:hypothetical protein
MLRNLNQSRPRGRVCGTPHSGVLAAAVLETAGGLNGDGLLVNDVLVGDPADCEYAVEILTWPEAGDLFVWENGAFSFSGAPDGTYIGLQQVRKKGIVDGDPTTYTFNVGVPTTTISCMVGDAVAAGLTASVVKNVTIAVTVGGVVADGLIATINREMRIACSIGEAAAQGAAASPEQQVRISCSVGNANAVGNAADVSRDARISCATGAAVAGGSAAAISGSQVVEPTPNDARTIVLPARVRRIMVPKRIRHFIVRKDMIHIASPKRPGESPVLSLNIARELAINGDAIQSLTTDIEIESGETHTLTGMLAGDPAYSGTVISQRVNGGLDGRDYNVKFTVTTPLQVLEYIVRLPVRDDGAFEA